MTLLLRDSLSLSQQLFAVATTLKSIDYNAAMTFILNNNNLKKIIITIQRFNSVLFDDSFLPSDDFDF